MKRRLSMCAPCCPRELYGTRFLHRRRCSSPVDRFDADSTAHCACPAVPDRVTLCGSRCVLRARCLVCGGARSPRLRRRHHGGFCLRGDDAQLGGAGGGNGKTLADPRDLGWSGAFGQHPYCRALLSGPRQRGNSGGRRGYGTQASRDRTLWTLPDWPRTCFDAPAGGTSGRISPGLPQNRKTGDST